MQSCNNVEDCAIRPVMWAEECGDGRCRCLVLRLAAEAEAVIVSVVSTLLVSVIVCVVSTSFPVSNVEPSDAAGGVVVVHVVV